MVFQDDYKYAYVRKLMLDAVREDLIGPGEEKEIIKDIPSSKYITGILYPSDSLPEDADEDFDLSDASHSDYEDAKEDSYEEEEEKERTTTGYQKPTSIGLSFYISKAVRSIKAIISWGTYDEVPKESEEEKEYIYVEGIGGLKAYVDPSVLKDTLDNWIAKKNYDADKLLVAKATYKLPFVTDNSTVSFINRCFPASLYPLNKTWNTSKTSYMYSPIGDIYSASNNAGSVNRSLSCYTGNISSVIQKLIGLSKDAVAANWTEYAMWFSPVSESTSSNYYSSSTTTTYSTDLTSYFIGKLNGPLHTDYPTVEVVFAVMND